MLFLLPACIFAANKVAAQTVAAQVAVTVNILPPYSPYYSDYSGSNASKVLLIIRNLTASPKSIMLTGQLTSDNGIKISTKSTYRPLQPILLQPNETKQLNGLALKDIFDLNSLNVYGVDKVKLVRTSRLPEGTYNFCLQAVDMNTNQVITDPSPIGCTMFTITYPNAPVLISPMAFAKVNATSVQNITFSWMNAGTVPMNTQYTIQVAEMPAISSDPNQVLNASTMPLLNQRVIGTSYVYGMANVPLKVGKKYAWRVIASDPSGRLGFMNDGKSQANVFVYGDAEQLAVVSRTAPITDLLNIITPVCKNGTDVITVGPNTNLNFNWLWKEQIESVRLFGSLDSNTLKHYTKVNINPIAHNIYEKIKGYRLHIYRQQGSAGQSLVTLNIAAPTQLVNLTKAETEKLGLVSGQTYKLIVTALNESGGQIARVESCTWRLQNEQPALIPKLTIKGKLNYSFDKTTYYGANKASITLQLLNSSTAKVDKNLKLISGGKFVSQPVAYATTDINGNFTAEIEQLPSDTGSRFLAVAINTGYYQVPENNLPIKMPKIAAVSDGGMVNYKQEELSAIINTNVYNRRLTVTLTKKFNSEYTGIFKDQNGKDVKNSYSVDEVKANLNAKVSAGILVGIYRKTKADYVPRYEGDIAAKSAEFPLQNGYTRVAEARTIVKDGLTQVVFDRILFSYASDDEYYIKALLPKVDPKNTLQEETDADIVAPEQRIASTLMMSKPWKVNYETTADYVMVSKKPPTARIKGKIMQQWPSAPGVLYPYANKPFTVKMISKNNLDGQVISNGDCQTFPSVVQQKIRGADGVDRYFNLPGTANSFDKIVATGVTDKDGNYNISILDFVEMKDFNVELVKTSNTPEGKTCAQIEAEKKAAEDAKLAAQTEKLKNQSKTGDAGYVTKGEGAVKMIEQQIGDMRRVVGGGFGVDGKIGKEGTGGDLEFISLGAGSSVLTQQNSALTQTASGLIRGLAAPKAKTKTMGAFTGMIPADNDMAMHFSGPSAMLDPQDAWVPEAPAVAGILTRYFTIEGINPVSTINNDQGNTAAHFVVQPFGTVNLGISIVNIDEVSDFKVKAVVKVASLLQNSNYKYEYKDAKNADALNGALMVVFRSDKKRPAAGEIPPGEGAAVHPIKKLINTSYADNAAKYSPAFQEVYTGIYKQEGQKVANGYQDDVEWVLDKAIKAAIVPGTNTATFSIGNERLWKMGNYMALITPNPEGNGGRFDPIIIDLRGIGTNNTTAVNVQVAPSRIAGRVMDNNSLEAIPNAPVSLMIYDYASTENNIIAKPKKTINADLNGYFEIVNGANGISWNDNDHFSAASSPAGYTASPNNKLNDLKSVNALKALKANGQNYEAIIKKTYGAKIKGVIMGEPFVGIDAYVIREDGYLIVAKAPLGKVVENYVKGLPVAAGKSQKIKIIPVDPAYVPQEITIPPIAEGTELTKNITLKRRLHRMLFDITTTDGQKIPNGDLSVTINNGTKRFTIDSRVKFEFENVSVDNYTIQVADANGNGYIPKIFSITNTEGEESITYPVKVEKGATIKGKVTLNGAAAKKARVYISYSATDAIPSASVQKTDMAALEDYTNDNGEYEIKGLPTANYEFVKVYATMSSENPNVMVNGAYKNIQILNKMGTADFVLSTFDGPVINNVYGFPLSVEKIEKVPGDKVKVTGVVDLSKNNSSFTWLNPDTKLRISDVIFDGANKYQPVDIVPLDALKELKMKYLDQYNVLLEKTSGSTLGIQSTSKGGAVMARVSIADNSFNFPAAYLNFTQTDPSKEGYNKPIQFYLSELGAGLRDPNRTKISAIYSGAKESTKYYLSDKTGESLGFSFIGFKTTARARKSYIGEDRKIHLDINFQGAVPKSTPGTVDIDINDLVLDGNKIYPAKKTDPLIVNLQTWKLEVRDWELNVEKGGIYSTNSLIKTGLIDIPVGTFNLRSDMCVIKDFDVTKLSLGGGMLPLTGISKTNSNFNLVFDEACGSDHGPHWRFSATSLTSSPVATIAVPVVPGKFEGATLNVDYFQLISYNKEDLVSLSSSVKGSKLFDNPKFMFYPASVVSNVDSYALAGQAAFQLPRVNNSAMNLLFTKGGNGNLDVQPTGFKMNFEGRGYVQFTNDQDAPVVLYPNLKGVTGIRGKVVEPGKFNPIPCVLNFGVNNDGKIILDKDYVLNLDGEGPATSDRLTLKIGSDLNKNGMMVQSNKDWGTLKFSGVLDDPKSKSLVTKKPVYDFEVLGDIQANADGITMEKASPFGNVKMSYDFAAKQMMGSLHMSDVDFGSYKFSGDVEISYGSAGMLILGAGQLNTGTLLVDGFGTFNIGMLIANGNIGEGSIQKATQYSKAKENICWLRDNKDNFQGFFLSGGYDIINEHKGFDIGIASIYLNAVLGVEASVGANFNKPSFRALVGAHGEVSAGMSAITGTSISGSVAAHITASAEYNPSGFAINGNAGVTVGYRVSQYLVLKTVTFDGSQDAKVAFQLKKGGTKFDFSLGKDNGVSECPPIK